MSQNPPFDASIPVLTEVLDDTPPPAAPITALFTAPVPAAIEAAAPAAPETLEAQAAHSFGGDEWELLERRLSERILQQLQGRVDFVLEQRIKDSMEEVLSHALRDLTMEIRSGLHETLSRIVSRAVAQELTHLQAHKK